MFRLIMYSAISLCTLALSLPLLSVAKAATVPNLLTDVGDLKVGGTGCQDEDVIEARYPRSGKITLFFPHYKATANRTDRSDARKACAAAVPIDVAPNRRIVVKNVSLSARVRLAPRTTGLMRLETFFSGTVGTPLTETVTATSDQVNRLVKLNDSGIVLRGECGQPAILRLNTAANLVTQHPTDFSQVTVTSLRLTVMSEACESTIVN